MSGGADLFRVLSQTENLGALVADTRPSLVVDRTGTRLLWANAAGAAFFGVTTLENLTALRFASASPFARRIATLDDILVSSQDRIERLPLQRGLLPRPTVCKASRVQTNDIKAILLTIVDGTGSFAGDPIAAFATLTASAQPGLPAPIATVGEDAEAEPAEEAAAEAIQPDATEQAEANDEVAATETIPDEIVPDLVADNTEAIVDAPLPEPLQLEPIVVGDVTTEAPVSDDGEEEAPREPDAPTNVEVNAEEADAEPIDAAMTEAELVASTDLEDVAGEALPEPIEYAQPVSEEAVSEVAEPSAEDASVEPEEASPETLPAPTFVFPTHGRAVRFVFELDPLLAFTFVSADLAATVGPDMADILSRTWSEVAGRLEFDPAGRVAEALGHRDTFTGLTVDWPVEGEHLRVPADLAGMPVFGRERAFRGYRGFGVLKTGAAFEAPIPAEPIAASEPDETAPLPQTDSAASTDVAGEMTAGATTVIADDTTGQLVADEIEIASDFRADETSEDVAPPQDVTTENDTDALSDVARALEALDADITNEPVTDATEEPAETDPASEDADETVTETADEPIEIVAVEPEELPPIETTLEPGGDDIDAEMDDELAVDTTAPEPEDLPDEPVAAGEGVDELKEPLPLVPPPTEEDVLDAVDPEPVAPTVSDVTTSPTTSHRTTFASLTGDKARALSKPERDAFDKIAEALADAFGPRIMAEPADRPPVHPVPVVAPKVEAPTELGPSIDVALLDKLPVALAILRGGDIIHANRAFLDLCGYPDVASIDADGGFAQVFEGAALSRDAAIPAVRRRDGIEIPVSARLHSMPMEGGIASLLVVQETAAATSRDRLAIAEQRAEDMEAILDTATDGVLVLDHKGLVIGANKSAEALFGNERSHMIGMAFVDLLAPESHRSALDYLDGLGRNALSSVLNDGREVIGRVAGGGLVPLFMTVGRVSTTKFCAVLRDITQWKRAEEELTSAKKAAENASSQKSDFLAKMSHEIRTPLNAIIGFSEVMMEERFGPVGNDRYKEYLRDIHVSGTHIMSLVNDLLDLSKIEAGKLELTFEAVGLNDVVRECAALMQPQANRERIIIRTSLSSSLPPVVADNRSLRQIILNLLSNAVKFNSAGGQVIISTLYEESGEVVLRVRDTGQGMSEGDIVKAMEPFRQLSTSRTGGGTGLGLPLTKALVEANRASFQIDSTPGQGTMIQITFPSTRVLAE
ncbi:ATP-binding protein [Pleomorphomonas sp. NRK KF1]|uniref:PAS domain-containing sensor histidine kinase n=1 Tax=Pleomorphomonas sp. NRK KF1 TaxID=2943000 RepID=UPI002042FF65|nr:ATP-binding protein [Pleomorphomonas sp. NRK KF1]MCM5553250.1 ATP-binding protein [Pleomorphomonas sp. NRK KF1]